MGAVGQAVTQAVVHPVQQLVDSTKKVVTQPDKANLGDFVSAFNPSGATIVSDVKHPQDFVVRASAAAGIAGATKAFSTTYTSESLGLASAAKPGLAGLPSSVPFGQQATGLAASLPKLDTLASWAPWLLLGAGQKQLEPGGGVLLNTAGPGGDSSGAGYLQGLIDGIKNNPISRAIFGAGEQPAGELVPGSGAIEGHPSAGGSGLSIPLVLAGLVALGAALYFLPRLKAR